MKKLMYKFGGVLAALALMVTSMSVNSTCAILMYQPEIPEVAKRLQRK